MLSVVAPKFCFMYVLPSSPRFPFSSLNPIFPLKFLSRPTQSVRQTRTQSLVFCSRSSEAEEEVPAATEDEWLTRLPERKQPLYSHSLPCIAAWLRNLGFYQKKYDPAVWFVENPDWHAQLLLDVTDLYIRYLKSGPGNLEKDVERRFSYALSREDIENAILGGP